MKTPKYKGIPEQFANAEIEKGEHLLLNDLRSFAVGGKYHSQGGTDVVLEEGTKIFSQKLKAPKSLVATLTGKKETLSFADMAALYPTIPYIQTLVNQDANKVEQKTAEIMLSKNIAQLNTIFKAQEEFKESKGISSPQPPQAQQQGQQQAPDVAAPDNTQQTFKYGGSYFTQNSLPKFVYGDTMFGDPTTPKKPAAVAPEPNTGFLNMPNGNATMDNTFGNILLEGYKQQPERFTITGGRAVYNPASNNNFSQIVSDGLKGVNIRNSANVGNAEDILLGFDRATNSYSDTPLDWYNRNTRAKAQVDASNWSNDRPWNLHHNDGSIQRLTQQNKNSIDWSTVHDSRPENQGWHDGHYYGEEDENGTVIKPSDNVFPVAIVNLPAVPSLPMSNVPNLAQSMFKRPDPTIPTPLGLPTIPKSPDKLPPDYIGQSLKTNMLAKLMNMATSQMAPVDYNYNPVPIAYQRFEPQNTLAVERAYNMNTRELQNSNLPEQLKAAYSADALAKSIDGSSQVQLQNQQGKNQIDNQNAQLFNTLSSSNIQNKTQYEDKYSQLKQTTLDNFNKQQEVYQNKILDYYDAIQNRKQDTDLLNKLGENYQMVNGTIQYIPGSTGKPNYNRLSLFQQQTDAKAMQIIMQHVETGKVTKAESDMFEILSKRNNPGK